MQLLKDKMWPINQVQEIHKNTRYNHMITETEWLQVELKHLNPPSRLIFFLFILRLNLQIKFCHGFLRSNIYDSSRLNLTEDQLTV